MNFKAELKDLAPSGVKQLIKESEYKKADLYCEIRLTGTEFALITRAAALIIQNNPGSLEEEAYMLNRTHAILLEVVDAERKVLAALGRTV